MKKLNEILITRVSLSSSARESDGLRENERKVFGALKEGKDLEKKEEELKLLILDLEIY